MYEKSNERNDNNNPYTSKKPPTLGVGVSHICGGGIPDSLLDPELHIYNRLEVDFLVPFTIEYVVPIGYQYLLITSDKRNNSLFK